MVFIFLSRSDKFVLKHPGSMMWMVTPKCLISRRSPSQNASTPYLDMAYDTAPGTLTIPNALATLTIRPLVCLRRGRNALVTDIVPQRLTSTTFFMSSMVVHSTKPDIKIPALFTIAHKPEEEVIIIDNCKDIREIVWQCHLLGWSAPRWLQKFPFFSFNS